MTDTEFYKKYRKNRLIVCRGYFHLHEFVEKLDSTYKGKKKHILYSEFESQTRWNNIQKSRLIESLILNIPIPPVYFYEQDYASYQAINGSNQLMAIYDFLTKKFALEGLEYWKELNGKRIDDLPDDAIDAIMKRHFGMITVFCDINEEGSVQALKKLLFDRLNLK